MYLKSMTTMAVALLTVRQRFAYGTAPADP